MLVLAITMNCDWKNVLYGIHVAKYFQIVTNRESSQDHAMPCLANFNDFDMIYFSFKLKKV